MVKEHDPTVTARPPGTRARMVAGAVELMREAGVPGTTIDAVLARSRTPRGSVYHHFPGGRAQLITEAVRSAGAQVESMIAREGDPLQALEGLARFWRSVLRASDYRATCPVVALAVVGDEQVPGSSDVVGEVFTAWRAAYADILRRNGLGEARAQRLASLALSALEGAVILCRAEGSTGPLDDAIAELTVLLRHGITSSGPGA